MFQFKSSFKVQQQNVCVCEKETGSEWVRERKREREREKGGDNHNVPSFFGRFFVSLWCRSTNEFGAGSDYQFINNLKDSIFLGASSSFSFWTSYFSGANLTDVCTCRTLDRLYFETLVFEPTSHRLYHVINPCQSLCYSMLLGALRSLALLWPQSMSVSQPAFIRSVSGSSKGEEYT